MFSVLKFDIEEKMKILGMSYLWNILLSWGFSKVLMGNFGTAEIELVLHMAYPYLSA